MGLLGRALRNKRRKREDIRNDTESYGDLVLGMTVQLSFPVCFPQVLARFSGSWVAAGSMDWLTGKGKGKSDGGHLANE